MAKAVWQSGMALLLIQKKPETSIAHRNAPRIELLSVLSVPGYTINFAVHASDCTPFVADRSNSCRNERRTSHILGAPSPNAEQGFPKTRKASVRSPKRLHVCWRLQPRMHQRCTPTLACAFMCRAVTSLHCAHSDMRGPPAPE